MPTLTPEERTLRARMGAHAAHAKHSPDRMLAAARKASPGQLEYYYDQVDPGRSLTEAERDRRAAHAKSAYFTGLSLKSAKARRERKAAGEA